MGLSFFNPVFAPAKRTSPLDNTDYELSDAYKPTGSVTQPERSLTGGASAPDPGAGAHPFSPPGTSGMPGSGSSQPGTINDPYAPMMKQLSDATAKLQDAYSAPHAGTARQIFGAILSRRNPGLGGLVSGETQRNRAIEQAQEGVGIASNQLASFRAQQNQQIENNLKTSQAKKADADAAYATSHANVIENPVPKATPEEMAMQDYIKQGKTPAQAYAQVQQDKQDTKPDKTAKPSEEDKALSDYLQGHNLADTPANRDKARDVLKTRDRVPKDPEVADLTKQLKQAQLEKMKEPTPDEQRRDDLARNAEENLDQLQDILKRRPELFGPLAGRVTGLRGMIGTNDPDVSRLKAIKEFYGMASVGAHAMRNAQHVATSADAIMNGFTNGPQAMAGAIDTARHSFQTFHSDAAKRRSDIDRATGGGGGNAAAPTAASIPSFADWKKSQQ